MIALILRDLRLAIRAGGGFGLALGFFLVLVALVPFAIGPEPGTLALIAPGILWLGALLASQLSLDRILALDWEDGSLDTLATSPLPLEGVVIAKAFAHWLTTGLPLALSVPVLGLLLNLPPAAGLWLCASLIAGTPALSLLGTFGAALTVSLRRGGLLLSLLVLPLTVPVLIFGARFASDAGGGDYNAPALALTGGVSLLAAALVPFAAAGAIRVNLK